MEPVHSIPLALPPSPLSVLLVNFFDPRHTLDTLAKSLSLTIEGLLDYIALPHVAAALDHAEALIYRRAAHRATAAIEQVLSELQSLPSLPAAPTPADTDRHRKHLEATRRAADLLRKYLPSPRGPHSAPLRQHPRVLASPHSAPSPRHDSRSGSEHDLRRVQPRLEADDALIEHPALFSTRSTHQPGQPSHRSEQPCHSAPPCTLALDHFATSSPPDHSATSSPLLQAGTAIEATELPSNATPLPLGHFSPPSLHHFTTSSAPRSTPPCTLALDHFATSSGTPYSRGQAG